MSLPYHLDPRQGSSENDLNITTGNVGTLYRESSELSRNPLEMDRTDVESRVVDRFMKNIPQVCGRRYGGSKDEQNRTEQTERAGHKTDMEACVVVCAPAGIHDSLEPIAQLETLRKRTPAYT
jgi:hypothetical protein